MEDSWLASELQARLPGIGALLADGTLSLSKARILAEEFQYLSDDDAARAEALVADQLAGKTPMQVARLAARAAASVDPDLARRRRENAQKEDARVRLWREQSGAASLGGFNLPTDEALAAYANVNARTGEYKSSRAFPDARMDQLRVLAYLDLLNGIPAAERIARAQATSEAEAARPATAGPTRNAAGEAGEPASCPCRGGDGRCVPTDDEEPGGEEPGGEEPGGEDDDGEDDSTPGEGTPGDGGPRDSGPGNAPGGAPSPPQTSLPPRVNLVIPLATLLGIACRPGEGHGLGPLDPALCLDLADTAANSPRSEWCVTVTDSAGIAIGHGCARFNPRGRKTSPAAPGAPRAALPARVNLTIQLTDLLQLANCGGRDGPGPWALGPLDDPGPPDGFGTWLLTLPGRDFTVALEPVPTYDCDHRNESRCYEPTDRLRHLVQIRDGDCTFPPCTRHARESDFEHAQPFHKGGRTCACNAGARSRRCHRVKQSPGWRLTQPRPGWHQWETPSGRVYTQGPMRYPV